MIYRVKMVWLICVSLVFAFPLFGAEVFLWDDLPKVEGVREVKVRGFLYASSDGNVILAAEPNLKTCCVGASHKMDRQIIVEGLEPIAGRGGYSVVTVEGELERDGTVFRLKTRKR